MLANMLVGMPRMVCMFDMLVGMPRRPQRMFLEANRIVVTVPNGQRRPGQQPERPGNDHVATKRRTTHTQRDPRQKRKFSGENLTSQKTRTTYAG